MEAGTLPVLGYNLWWDIRGVRVDAHTLEALYRQYGFLPFLPEPPTDLTALKRALHVWRRARQEATAATLAQAGTPVRKREVKLLIRGINQRGTKHAVFGLVGEQINFDLLGLRYATEARILIEKLPPDERAQREPAIVCTTEAEGLIEAEDEARSLTEEIRPLWHEALTTYLASDISGSILQIIESLSSTVKVRDAGGVYFVAAQDEATLRRLQQLIQQLPLEGNGPAPCLILLPVPDEKRAKAELALAVQRGFLAELHVAGTKLEDLRGKSKQIGASTIAARLIQVRQIRDRAATYADLLGMQQEVIQQSVERLTQRAQQFLEDVDGDEEPETVAQDENIAAGVPDHATSLEES